MVIAFLLAQLMLPGPPSSPIQPPGMICASGSCERGPMVYRTSVSRSRLVVACDMRSATCSDGRQITTVRATPVPCEVSPGVWEMVGPNEGCYGVRGLESWTETTSYLSYGAQLDHPAWSRHSGISVAARDGVWEIMRNRVSLGGVYQDLLDLAPVEPEAWTASCVMKAGTSSAARLVAQRGAGWARIQLTENWNTYSVTNTVQPGQLPGLVVGPDEDQKSILVAGCWLTRASTPGRPCWGGEAPVTCAGDGHRISTEGWPTENVEMCITFTIQQEIEGRRLFDSRPGNSLGMLAYTRTLGRIAIQTNNVATSFAASDEWVIGRQYRVCIRRSNGSLRVTRDGVEMTGAREFPEIVWGHSANLGADSAYRNNLNGFISSLTIRSYEEVSP